MLMYESSGSEPVRSRSSSVNSGGSNCFSSNQSEFSVSSSSSQEFVLTLLPYQEKEVCRYYTFRHQVSVCFSDSLTCVRTVADMDHFSVMCLSVCLLVYTVCLSLCLSFTLICQGHQQTRNVYLETVLFNDIAGTFYKFSTLILCYRCVLYYSYSSFI